MSAPSVTLAWAQSLDGCIAAAPGRRTALSCPESLRMTHGLRAEHEAILVGVGTVLADDPSLTVRLVEGRSPRPLVLDAGLRCPAGARLLAHPSGPLLLVCAPEAPPERRRALEAAGAEILALPRGADGLLDLEVLLGELGSRGLGSLMVEGGARVLVSFLRARLVDRIVVTIAPLLLGGLAPFAEPGAAGGLPCELEEPEIRRLGRDIVVAGRPRWPVDRPGALPRAEGLAFGRGSGIL